MKIKKKISYSTEKGTECQDQSYADWKHYLLLGIYTGLGLVSFLIAFFLLDDLEIESHGSKITDYALLTGNHIFRSLDQKLLIPFCIFTGVQASFIFEAFTAGFVACTFGKSLTILSRLFKSMRCKSLDRSENLHSNSFLLLEYFLKNYINLS